MGLQAKWGTPPGHPMASPLQPNQPQKDNIASGIGRHITGQQNIISPKEQHREAGEVTTSDSMELPKRAIDYAAINDKFAPGLPIMFGNQEVASPQQGENKQANVERINTANMIQSETNKKPEKN